MRKEWQDETVEKYIYEEGQKLTIPDSLQPENIKERLQKKEKIVNISRRRKIYQAIAGAAVLFVIVGSTFTWNQIQKRKEIVLPEKKVVTVEETKAGITYADSYEDVEKVMEEVEKLQREIEKNYSDEILDREKNGMMMEESATVDSEMSTQKETYVSTNVQVEGIDEADVVKTDGEYIYYLGEKDGSLHIVKASDVTEKGYQETSTVYLDGDAMEFYIYEDMLLVFLQRYDSNDVESCIVFYDAKDKSNIKQMKEITQTGDYCQSRLVDGYLYMVTGEYAYPEETVQVPKVNASRVEPGDICIPKEVDTTEFTTISSVSVKEQKVVDTKSVVNSSDNFYMSKENIYFYRNLTEYERNKDGTVTDGTEILKFSYKQGKIQGENIARVKGKIKDTFAINEYEGMLRVITSVYQYDKETVIERAASVFGYTSIRNRENKETNAVYVLDADMECIGKIENLAEDERVYSARFMGDMGYFVTYRETDPLFSVDFSDPQNPKIVGELKIPGFSEYLHFYDENTLLGIGVEETEFHTQMKLSMFDIANPKNVKEMDKKVLEYTYSPALYDYKSVLVDTNKKLVGFAVYGYDIESGYSVYSYKEGEGFTEVVKILGDAEAEEMRGLIIGDVIYVVEMYSGKIHKRNLK